MDFQFPVGTVVHDQILGTAYKVKDPNHSDYPMEVPDLSLQQTNGPSASDADLAEAARQAMKLVNESNGSSHGFKVSPNMVLVRNTRTDYSIDVEPPRGTSTPELTNHNFSGSGLVLNSITDQLTAEGNIIASVTREPSHTGYAEGTLELQFAGRDKLLKVKFVFPGEP
jgi:hypothetical protein